MPQRASIKTTPKGIEVQIEYNKQAEEAIKGLIDKDEKYDSNKEIISIIVELYRNKKFNDRNLSNSLRDMRDKNVKN